MKEKHERIWNVPNALTMLRMLLIPVYWVLYMSGRSYFALAVFVLASATDLLDGYIARKHHLITSFGKLMDPLADKLMVISVMLSMVITGVLPWPPLAILLLKETLMVLGGAVMLKKGVVVYAKKAGKYAQTLVVASLLLSFFADWFNRVVGVPVHLIVLWCAVALTLYAFVFYARDAARIMAER